MIVSEISWDDMWSGKPLPESSARKAYREAVAEIAEKAKVTLPDCIGRVDSAVKIVLAGDVELLQDGTAKVASQSNGSIKYFLVNGECTCKDYPKAPSHWCKHKIAAGLAKRARTLAKAKLEQIESASNGTTQPATEQPQSETVIPPVEPPVEAPVESEPATPIVDPSQSEQAVSAVSLPEAPASANVYVTIAGRKVQLTLRDHDEDNLLSRMERLLSRFPSEEEPAESEASSTPPEEGWCYKHNAKMRQYSKGGRTWYSHMTANGWCNDKNGKGK